MEKLIEEDDEIDQRDEEIDGKIDHRRGWRTSCFGFESFLLKGDLFEYFIILGVLMWTFNFSTLRLI
jgi:hypothetical protein